MSISTKVFGLDSESGRLSIAEENLILDVQIEINSVMRKHSVSEDMLANRLNVSLEQVTLWLSDAGGELTVRDIARIFHAMDKEVEIRHRDTKDI
jgi:hypothetical protein